MSISKASFDPQHTNVHRHTDGIVTSVYFFFVFMIDGEAENYWSESWQLVKGIDGWKIAAISYSSNPSTR